MSVGVVSYFSFSVFLCYRMPGGVLTSFLFLGVVPINLYDVVCGVQGVKYAPVSVDVFYVDVLSLDV